MPSLVDIGSAVDGILDKFVPDAKDKLAAKAELARIADLPAQREHAEAMGQIETNKIEAAHASVFVAGWRPFIGWTGGVGVAIGFVVYPVNVMLQAWRAGQPIPEYPVDNLLVLVGYLLGWSGIRAFEKLKGTAFSNLGENPGMAMTRTVEGTATPALATKLPIATHDGPPPTPVGNDVQAQEGSPQAPAPFTAAPVQLEPTLRAALVPTATISLSRRPIAWGKKVSEEFCRRVLWIEQDLGLRADYLMACMAYETGGKFTANVRNLAGSSGTGLIQFMEFTAKRLGTTTAKLAAMTAEDQLNYVWKYFRQFGTDFRNWTLEDTYMAILYPAAIGKPNDWRFPWAATSLSYKQNKGLDKNKDGLVTKAEACAGVRKMLREGLERKG